MGKSRLMVFVHPTILDANRLVSPGVESLTAVVGGEAGRPGLTAVVGQSLGSGCGPGLVIRAGQRQRGSVTTDL